jgi:hypothetical protein
MCREPWNFTDADIMRSISDLYSIKENLLNEVNRITSSSVGASSAVNVCFMFCSIVEIGMQDVMCFANKTRPKPFMKSVPLESYFVWPTNKTRESKDSHFNFNLCIHRMPEKLGLKLKEFGTIVIPWKKDNDAVYYTLPSFMFSAGKWVSRCQTPFSLSFCSSLQHDMSAM